MHAYSRTPTGGQLHRLSLALLALVALSAPAGCMNQPVVAPPSPAQPDRPTDRQALATLAAAAKDLRYVATYTLASSDRSTRIVTVAVATDGSWVVAVPAGALSGLVDIAIFSSKNLLYQCAMGPTAGAPVRPDLGPMRPGCVRVSALTPSTDPRVHHIFTDWIDALLDRATALSVTATAPLAGSRGQCFSVEPTSAALAPPVDPGIYCYDESGVLTGARISVGTLTLAGPVAPAPPAVAQPAPIVPGPALPLTAPPPPPTPASTPP